MLVYQALLLAVTISSASVTLANILPDYEHYQYPSDQHSANYQFVPHYNHLTPPSAERQHTEQLTTRQLLARVHTEGYPYYGTHPDPFNLVRLPIFQHHPLYLPRSALHMNPGPNARHPIFVGYPYPLIVHHQYRRSCKSDSAGTEPSESATGKHEADVAAEPSLINIEHSSTVNDSLSPEHELTDTDEKRVNSQQSKRYDAGPFLFGLNPQNMYAKYHSARSDTTERSKPPFELASASPIAISSTPSDDYLSSSTIIDSAQSVDAPSSTQTSSTSPPQAGQQDSANSYVEYQEEHRNMLTKTLKTSSTSSTQMFKVKESSDRKQPSAAVDIKSPCTDSNQSHALFIVDFAADCEETGSNASPATETGHDQVSSADDALIYLPNFDTASVPTFHVLPNDDVAPWFAIYHDHDHYGHYDYHPHDSTDADYVTCKSTYSTGDNYNLAMDTTTLLDVLRMRQFSETYNYNPTKMRYTALPDTRKCYHVPNIIPSTYSYVPLYRIFSSRGYY